MGTTGIWFHGQKGRTSNQHFSKITVFFEATEPKDAKLRRNARAFVAFISLFVNV
jgi:hypothetical protein